MTLAFVGDRLWLDFVNTDSATIGATLRSGRRAPRTDVLEAFMPFLQWLQAAGALDGERATAIQRRAEQQPVGAAAVLADARRLRAALRGLAERGSAVPGDRMRDAAVAEINRVLGRSTGTRRLDLRGDGRFTRNFAPVGDAFAALVIPVAESAADSFVTGELPRVRRCADSRCGRVFYDGTKNRRRRWCEMSICGNRAKAARHRARRRSRASSPGE